MAARLDRVLQERHPDFSRSRIEGLVKAGLVTVNGVVAGKAGLKVDAADEIVVTVPPPVPAVPGPEDIPLDVVFEDDDLVVVNKPAGLVVHPAPGHVTGTLVNALLYRCPDLSGIGGVARPGIVHRLDQDTSGLLVVAKSQAAMDGLVRAFASHRDVEKTYLAICHGRPRLDSGRVESLIGRHPADRKRMAVVARNGKPAITNWRVPKAGERLSAGWAVRPPGPAGVFPVECRIETGRTHQIRVHLAALGCPVIGDRAYGKPALDRRLEPVPARQMLHAWKLALWHPVTRAKLSLEAPFPPDLAAYLERAGTV